MDTVLWVRLPRVIDLYSAGVPSWPVSSDRLVRQVCAGVEAVVRRIVPVGATTCANAVSSVIESAAGPWRLSCSRKHAANSPYWRDSL